MITKRPLRLGYALREALREGYDPRDLRADVLAGLVVGVVALPLSMALAIASGAPPQHGLYTAIVAGTVCAILGGSRVVVSGPTAAFVVILAPISARYGIAGLVTASALAGLIMIAMGCFRLGRLIEFVPYPVTTGFTAGIGFVIASFQLKDFLGLSPEALPGDAMWHERMGALFAALSTIRPADLVTGAVTLVVLVFWRRLRVPVPGPLGALVVGALVAAAVAHFGGGAPATLASRFGTSAAPSGIPGAPPLFVLPWNLPDAGGATAGFSLAYIRLLLPAAFAIALLGAIESLLAAVVADGMTGQRHHPDVELIALGTANVAAGFFGGFAATGALARTATNVRAGGRSPVAALVHAGFVLASVLAIAPLLGHLPMASLAALLLVVAWNMSEARHVIQVVRTAPKSDTAVLLTCFVLTVVFDMTLAVMVGFGLAGLLFMRRMADITGAELIGPQHPQRGRDLPPGVLVYDIHGPLFFGAAHKATRQLLMLDHREVATVVLNLQDVPVIDATGIVNLRAVIERLRGAGVEVILSDLRSQPRQALEKARLIGEGGVAHHATLAEAVAARRP